jgi:glycosyltransferase involved in cell wall biosynthesis
MKDLDTPLVSVMTPVYNGEQYLRECIDSVLNQTYKNWEYTIVNNCSADRTLEIANEYAARDPRIKVHNNEQFLRVNANFNNAFRRISPTSKYCKIVSADDWLYEECLEKMVALAEQHPTVAIVGAYTLSGLDVIPVGLPYTSKVVSGPELCRKWLLKTIGHPFGTPTSVMYRSEIVRNRDPFFNESSLAADQEVCVETLASHDFGFVHQVLSYLRQRDESLTSFSIRMNTYLAANLYELKTYGPKHLNGKELQRRTDECLDNYYRYLSKQVYNRRDAAFWDYHRARLDTLGYPLNRVRLAFGVLLEGLSFMIDPERVLRRLFRVQVGAR